MALARYELIFSSSHGSLIRGIFAPGIRSILSDKHLSSVVLIISPEVKPSILMILINGISQNESVFPNCSHRFSTIGMRLAHNLRSTPICTTDEKAFLLNAGKREFFFSLEFLQAEDENPQSISEELGSPTGLPFNIAE